MPSFFIDRPIFAWVVAIFIMVAGAIAIPQLPISQYPDVAPPQISITATYPGASSQDTYQSVTRLIEDELNGVDGLLYFESTSSAQGSSEINVTFEPGTDPAQAAVDELQAVHDVDAHAGGLETGEHARGSVTTLFHQRAAVFRPDGDLFLVVAGGGEQRIDAARQAEEGRLLQLGRG